MELDYSPLNETTPTPIQSDKTNIPQFNNTAGAILFTLVIVGFTGILIFPVLLSPFIYLGLKKWITKSGYSAIRLSNFAVKNGFRYQWRPKTKYTKVSTQITGVLGSKNKKILASNIISGTYKDINFHMFNPYNRGFYTIMVVQLKNKYPHIVLDSRANNPYFSNIGLFFKEDSRVHLEGDFDKYFSAYSKAPAVDILRILSPDMMSIMIESGHKYDIEIVEDHLHIISNYKYSDEQGVKYFFDLADSLMDKLDRRSATKSAKFDSVSRVE